MSKYLHQRIINKHQRRDAFNFLRKFSPLLHWQCGESFVDIGCGPGDVTRDILWPMLPHNLKRLVCMDLSHEHLVQCRKEFHDEHRVSCLNVDMRKKQDFSHLPAFDHAISLMCFHWIPEQRVAMENVANLLKSGGNFFFTFVADCPNRKINEELFGSTKWQEVFRDADKSSEPYCNSNNPIGILRKFLVEAGFTDVHAEIHDVIYQWDTPEEYLRYFCTFSGPLLAHLPHGRLEDFLQDQVDVAKKYGVITLERDAERNIDPYKIIVGFARKY